MVMLQTRKSMEFRCVRESRLNFRCGRLEIGSQYRASPSGGSLVRQDSRADAQCVLVPGSTRDS
jgi:hypothetical protein